MHVDPALVSGGCIKVTHSLTALTLGSLRLLTNSFRRL